MRVLSLARRADGLFSVRGSLIIHMFLFGVILFGWTLRLYGLNWDQGHGLHPDERYITWIASSIRLPDDLIDTFHPTRTSLNPYSWPPDGRSDQERERSFAYGHLPLYLMVLFSDGDDDEVRLGLVGRVLSALFDTATIVLTFALGRFLYGKTTGVLAAVFVALTVMHVQLAHLATFDTALTCFVVATLLFGARFLRHGRQRDAVGMGLCLGLAVGSKFSGALLLAPVMVAHVLRWERPLHRRPLILLVLSLFVALFAFGLTNPFSLLQPGAFIDNLKDQSAMVRGDDSFPFTRQYHGTTPYLYHIEQQLRWGMGVPLGVVAFGGLACVLVWAWRRSSRGAVWVPLTWAIVYFGLIGGLYVKFMRYMLPLSPVLMIFGARALRVASGQGGIPLRFASETREWRVPAFIKRRGMLDVGLGILIVLPTLFYALAFLNVYRGDHPWLGFSRWIYDNVSPGATILYERWDHQLPLTIVQDERTRWPGEYNTVTLDVYAPDTRTKLRTLLESLTAGDYLVIASNRLYGSIALWPDRYPLTRRYYQLLFEGRLGYQLVPMPDVERQPLLGPLALVSNPFNAAGLPSPLSVAREQPARLTLHLGRADESFTVYDHPRPLLFQNTERLSASEMARLFADLLD